jgi:hypothetical protein
MPTSKAHVALLVLALLAGAAQAATLYDASLGSGPADQGWMPLSVGDDPLQAVTVGLQSAYSVVTTGPGVIYFGNALVGAPTLDTAAGFDLSFNLKVVSETHASLNRAGYSVVMVGADPTKAVELSFWSGNIWVPDYDASKPDRFVRGQDAAFNTTDAFHTYRLSVRNQHYIFSTGGVTLLSGMLHDYTAGGTPYTQPNFLFFGDDSSHGTSSTELAWVSLNPVPEPTPSVLLLAGLVGLCWRARQRGTGRG